MSQLKKEDLSIKEENKEDFKQTVIQRKNLTNEFTIADIERHLQTLEKLKTETEATLGVARAVVDNIDRNHPEIKKMPAKKRHHIHMWQEHHNQVKQYEPQLEAINEEIAKHKGYIDVIYDAFGFIKSNPNDFNYAGESDEKGSEGDESSGGAKVSA